MIGKKINQLATELAPESTDLTIIGDPTTGVSKKITIAQLGAIFSGAVSFYNDLASFPVSGDINVIYCAKDTKKLYLWTGSAYVEVFPSQALLDTYQLRSEKGNANGYASLDSQGKVPISQLPSSIMEYKGTWNAATNTPTLANGTGDTGDVYICNVAGTVNFGAGAIAFAVGDYVIYSGTIWQRSSGAVGTVTSVGITESGDALTITGSPITTSGTINIGFAGTDTQYIKGDGTLATFPSLTGFVPYTGASANVDLGTFDLTADVITGAKGSFASNGGSDTFTINHSSGSGIALNITKGGNGEGLYINKTSGSGNAATIIGTLNATSLVKSGGTSTQFLKADGSIDSNTYLTASSLTGYVPYTGATANVDLGAFDISSRSAYLEGTASYQAGLLIKQRGLYNFVTGAYTQIVADSAVDLNIIHNQANTTRRRYALSVAALQDGDSFQYLLPRANGTIALTSDLTGGTVTSVAALTIGTSGTDLSSTVANGTTTPVITLNVPTASATNRGALSSTDWSTFNNKQNALTNPVTGTGTTNYLPKFTGTSTIGNSAIYDNSGNIGIGTTSASSPLDVVADNSTAINLRLRGRAADSVGQMEFWNNAQSTRYGYIATDSTSMGVVTTQSIPLIFGTNSSERMRLDASGNLGLGTTSPNTLLSLVGNHAGGQSILKIQSSTAYSSSGLSSIGFNDSDGSRKAIIYTNTNGLQLETGTTTPIIFNTNGNERMRLDASGNVGIGTTNPLVNLQVETTGTSTSIGGNVIATFRSQASGRAATIQLSDFTNSNFISSLSGSLSFGSAGTPLMTLTSAGNVGIGTTSPIDKLHIVGGITSTSLATPSNTSIGSLQIGYDGTNGIIRTWNSSPLITSTYNYQAFETSGSERMRITSGGNVGIGTSSPSAKLDVNGAFNSTTFVTNNSSTTINSSTNVNTAVLDCGIVVFRDRTNGGGCVVFYENNQTPIIISQSGATTFTVVTPLATQIQISNRSGARGLQALGGSSRNGVNLGWAVFRTEGGDA